MSREKFIQDLDLTIAESVSKGRTVEDGLVDFMSMGLIELSLMKDKIPIQILSIIYSDTIKAILERYKESIVASLTKEEKK